MTLVLCLPLPCCQNQGDLIALSGSDPANGPVASTNTSIAADGTFGSTSNPGTSGSGSLNQFSRYWVKAGDPISLSWGEYSLGAHCQGSEATFPLNLCSMGCTELKTETGVDTRVPKFCAFGKHSDELTPPETAYGSACNQPWPDNYAVILLPGGGVTPLALHQGEVVDAHDVGDESNLRLWLLRYPCTDGVCSSTALPVDSRSFLWSEGCSPSTLPYTPPLDAMTQDVSLRVWATKRQNLQSHPVPGPLDKAGPVLQVSGISGGRFYPRRIRFLPSCTAPCPHSSDPAESQWTVDPTDRPTGEAFSSKVRVKALRVYDRFSDVLPAAFCSAYIRGQDRLTPDHPGTETLSTNSSDPASAACDVNDAARTDCVASPGSFLNRLPTDDWVITFSGQDGQGATSRCPNIANRQEIWVQFTLGTTQP